MLYQFAITPDVFAPAAVNGLVPAGLIQIQILRGLFDTGLVANLHGGQWLTVVKRYQAHKDLPPSVRDDMESCLSLLHDRNRLVRHPAGSSCLEDDDFRWLKWSLERHRADGSNPMAGVISSDDFIALSEISDKALIPLSNALNTDFWRNSERSIRFTKTMSNLRKHIRPILRYAQKVTLVDPYMTCHEPRFFDTVQTIADLLGKHDGKQERGIVHIHAGDPQYVGTESLRESPENRLDSWERELRPVISQWGHTFRVFLWGHKPGGKSMHDRYIITDQCGVSAPAGLDFLLDSEEQRAHQTTWTLLNAENVQEILMEEFHKSKSPYKHLGFRQIGAP